MKLLLAVFASFLLSTSYASDLLEKQECHFWAGLAKQVATDRDAGVDVQTEIERVQNVATDKSNKYLRDDEDRRGVMRLGQTVWLDKSGTSPQEAYDKILKGCEASWAKQHAGGL